MIAAASTELIHCYVHENFTQQTFVLLIITTLFEFVQSVNVIYDYRHIVIFRDARELVLAAHARRACNCCL